MSHTTIEHGASIDLSQLLTFNVGFKNLEIVLQTILVRCDKMEKAQKEHAEDDDNRFDDALKRDEGLQQKYQDLEKRFNEHAQNTNASLEKINDLVAGLAAKAKELEKGVEDANKKAQAATDAADQAQDDIDQHRKEPHGSTQAEKASEPAPAAPAVVPKAKSPVDTSLLDRIAALENNMKASKSPAPVTLATSQPTAAAATDRHVDPEVIASQGVKLNDVEAKVLDLENRLGNVANSLKRLEDDSNDRFANVTASFDRGFNEIKKAAPPMPPAPSRSDSPLKEPVRDLQQDVANLRSAMDVLNNKIDTLAAPAPEVKSGNGNEVAPPEVTAAQFKLLKVSVDALERAPKVPDYGDAIRELQNGVQTLKHEVKTLGTECTQNHEACQRLDDTKANKSDIPKHTDTSNNAQSTPKPTATPRGGAQGSDGDFWRALGDANKRIEDLQRLIGNLDGKTRALDADKADKNALHALQDELKRLQSQLQQVSADRGPRGGEAAANVASESAIAQELQRQILPLVEEQGKTIDWTKGQVLEIRATIEHIHHSKADASLVANKAERDFVENSMEKLMREVEQVLNATNAGLIDTLDKSLNILRDMIDGKATKQDVNRLQSMINDDSGTGTVPEGLTGFKGYRCLGCNRTLEGMRQRPMGNNFTTFMNRLPNGPKATSSHGSRPTVSGPTPPAGYIGNTPQSH